MELHDKTYQEYVKILKDELVPAMGCTEPIAIAYLASYAKKVLGKLPDKVVIEVSGNVLKNVKSVVVPNTDKMKGIQAACAAGIVCGDANKKLEVISQVEDTKCIAAFMETCPIIIQAAQSNKIFDLLITLYSEKDYVKVRIVDYHTNIVYVEKNHEVLLDAKVSEDIKKASYDCLNIEDIFAFVQMVDIKDIQDTLDQQIKYNMAIAKEGLTNDYGANIGKVLLQAYGQDLNVKVKAYAAAASDARMNGCEMPVIIASGSGNQGITTSVPVIVWAKEKGYAMDKLYRSLALSNLVTIHLKSGIGRLSAFCGAVSAGAGAGAGIAYLESEDLVTISHTIVNALGIISGTICDGAKASCAAKIQAAIDAGITGYYMYINGQEFKDGEGLIVKGVENTINNIALLAREGMKETDKEIIKMMVKNC
ncbi:MAG: L-serine ammonia-lyase, iron-sulfur-dependent, subunit alpha [Erysipelotrichaceae bacterium]|nr:L-serine ammonia-lyase, iron-sulfur-dependent, subunit alpha [Erysipelotrichaceae bacterium]